MAEYTTEPWELGPLQAGERQGARDEPLRIPLQFLPQFSAQDFAQIPGKSWELILVYKDAFRKPFYTMHRKNPLQMNRLYREADSERYNAQPQPWVTIGKGTPPARSGEALVVGFVHRIPATKSGLLSKLLGLVRRS
jgi:hypothetical protein